ncbi:MAG: DUF2490 domain-containing protein [Flavobacterium sp.]|nr:DUF2490 domain-containing protein [Flavobacterium sp.]
MKKLKFIIIFLLILNNGILAQNTQQDDLGAWYMYFFNTRFKEIQLGIQGDTQYRNWNIIGDTEQLLLRTGLTYTPKNTNVLLTVGFANITTGIIGESNETSNENRIYQEALLPQKVGNRIYLTHRFRYEQRFVEYQDFRTRFRYNLFINIPLNKKELTKNAIYTAFYNELFINGEKEIGNNRVVNYLDRNRLYLGLGYAVTDKIRIQTGWMKQTTDNTSKNQLQFSLHHTF